MGPDGDRISHNFPGFRDHLWTGAVGLHQENSREEDCGQELDSLSAQLEGSRVILSGIEEIIKGFRNGREKVGLEGW